MGGMVCETDLQEVLQAVDGQNKREKAPTPAKRFFFVIVWG